jgi:hypothetical protein
MEPLRSAVGSVLVGATLLSAAAPTAAAPARDQAQRDSATIAAYNESLRRELELAEGDAFYLILDADGSSLSLTFRGAPLRETRVVSARIGEPRARHIGGDERPLDVHAIWTGGRLVPPRIDVREEVVPPPLAGAAGDEAGTAAGSSTAPQGEFIDGAAEPEATPVEAAAEEVEIPKTPEELYPVPASFEIRFAEGLTVEVERAEEPSTVEAEPASEGVKSTADGEAAAYPEPPAPTLWDRLVRFVRRVTLSRPEGERLRLHLVVDSIEADRLFRSLPPDVKLLIRRPAP